MIKKSPKLTLNSINNAENLRPELSSTQTSEGLPLPSLTLLRDVSPPGKLLHHHGVCEKSPSPGCAHPQQASPPLWGLTHQTEAVALSGTRKRVTREGQRSVCLHSLSSPSVGWTVLQLSKESWVSQQHQHPGILVLLGSKIQNCNTTVALVCSLSLGQTSSDLWSTQEWPTVKSSSSSTSMLQTQEHRLFVSHLLFHKGLLKTWGYVKNIQHLFPYPMKKRQPSINKAKTVILCSPLFAGEVPLKEGFEENPQKLCDWVPWLDSDQRESVSQLSEDPKVSALLCKICVTSGDKLTASL